MPGVKIRHHGLFRPHNSATLGRINERAQGQTRKLLTAAARGSLDGTTPEHVQASSRGSRAFNTTRQTGCGHCFQHIEFVGSGPHRGP